MTQRLLVLALLVASLALAAAACGGNDAGESAAGDQPAATTEETATTAAEAEEMDIVETAVAAGDFTTLVSLVEEAGLADDLSGPGPLTVFAPTDEAFAAVPEETLEQLRGDEEMLRQVLLYHVVEGEARAADVTGMDRAATLAGQNVRFRTEADAVYVNDAEVVTADVSASNGVIHAVDTVLLPPAR